MGVVHHSVYPVWFEMGRTELLRSTGISYRELEETGVLLAVVRLEVRYKRPARYDDELQLETRIASVGRVKIEHEYRLTRGDELLATATTTWPASIARARPARCRNDCSIAPPVHDSASGSAATNRVRTLVRGPSYSWRSRASRPERSSPSSSYFTELDSTRMVIEPPRICPSRQARDSGAGTRRSQASTNAPARACVRLAAFRVESTRSEIVQSRSRLRRYGAIRLNLASRGSAMAGG